MYNLKNDLTNYYTSTYTATKIKSLAGDNRRVTLNINSISRPICVTTPFSVSLTQLAWKNYTTNTEFGAITDYDYFIPVNWYVGTTQSSSISTPIRSTNNVTITPDAVTGTGQNILVRQANSCISNAAVPIFTVPITVSRPTPALSSSANNMCSGNTTFTLINIPSSGVSTTWNYSSNIAPVGTPTVTEFIGTRNSSANSTGYVEAVVTLPCTSTPYTTRYDIQVGLATPGINVESITGGTCTGDQIEATFIDNNIDFSFPPLTINWYWNGTVQSYQGAKLRKWLTYDGNYVKVRNYATSCGYSDYYEVFIPCDNFSMMMTPNPTSDLLTISTTSNSGKIYKIQIIDKLGTVMKQNSYDGLNTVQLVVSTLIPAIYTVQVYNGSKWASRKLQIIR
jgi:hypothetical protein